MCSSDLVREVDLDPDQNNQRVRQNILNAGIYAQLQTKLFTGFELMAGLRLDNATYFNKEMCIRDSTCRAFRSK